ncbi:MAG: A/G-specific adenine glycosylase [Haliscomenobacter sp.]|nr:A/G-specific adenine glycosylase [Haliscomenobacter sp.]
MQQATQGAWPPEEFRLQLQQWRRQVERPLPWKEEKDPYRIWVSEIILQQTRVEQGLPYFQRFIAAFPDLFALASAPEEQVFKLWEGLGYYSRARNMLRCARFLATENAGRFPDSYEGLLALPGIGPYTAAALASFAFALPHAVVDGNVERVLSRIWVIQTPANTASGKKQLQELGQSLLDPQAPGPHNQSMMDFGALHCTPRRPLCLSCPFQERCHALLNGQVDRLPVKWKKTAKTPRFFHYLLFRFQDQTWIRQRTEKDIWIQLYEFPLLETRSVDLAQEALLCQAPFQELLAHAHPQMLPPSKIYRQSLSHQIIHARFWEVPLRSEPGPDQTSGLIAVPGAGLRQYAFPRIIRWYLDEKSLSLDLF